MSNSSKTLAQLLLSGALAAAVAGILWFAAPRRSPTEPRSRGFREAAAKSGLDFHMSFLPQEQGDSFKINLYDHGCGLAVADYDGDGHDDVYFLNQLGANALYRNRGDGTFENVTERAGPLALGDRVCVGAAFGDYDNDGDQDLYVTSTRGGNLLFENEGGGRFSEITERAGVACVAHSETPAFFDYDGDGNLDLFVTNTARWTTDEFDSREHYYRGETDIWTRVYNVEDREPNVLFRNNGNGTFTDVTDEAGLKGNGWSGDVAIFDYDEDGDLDLFVSNMFGQSQLYENDGQGHFSDVTRRTLGRTSFGGIGSKVFDFNNDGRLDLLISDMHSDMWIDAEQPKAVEPHKKYRHLMGRTVEVNPRLAENDKRQIERLGLDYDDLLFGNSLFRNDGEGRFAEVSDAAGIETFWPWGIAVGDFDNDGYEDVYLPSGMGYPFFYYPSSLMMNQGDGTFADRAADQGIEPPSAGPSLPEWVGGSPAARSSRCAVTADFDGDGRLELMVNNFNDHPYYFKNRFAPRHYIAIRLQGTQSNRDAIGAVVKLHVGDQIFTRQVSPSGGYLSQSSKTLHFGLGDHDRIDSIEIRWPRGRRQTLEALAVDRLHEVIEPEN
ncbi:MAG TPA: CRTAC1 family protein [Pirellulales bacterium]|nr:CRTAC1 family protein [Pirellulales bacterium]